MMIDDDDDYIYKDDDFDAMQPQVSVKKKLFRKLRKFSAKNIENMITLSRSLFSLYVITTAMMMMSM